MAMNNNQGSLNFFNPTASMMGLQGATSNPYPFNPSSTQSFAPYNLSNIGTNVTNPSAGGEDPKGFFSKNFKNQDGSLNFGNLGQGVDMLGNLAGAYLALQQIGIAKDAFQHNKALDLANLSNSAKLAQHRLDLQNERRAIERPDLYGGQQAPQLQQNLDPQTP